MANLATGVVSSNGYSSNDMLTSIEALIGSNQGDTITTGATTASVNTGSGNDTIISAIANGLSVLNGGADTDTLDYSAQPGLVGSFTNSTATFTRGAFTDSVINIERFTLGNAGDNMTIDTGSITGLLSANSGSFNAGGGSDTIAVSTGTGNTLTGADIDGDTMANIFRNIETLDFRSTDLTGGDRFDITSAQVVSMTDSGKALKIIIDGTNIAFSDINVTGSFTTSTSGNIQTYTFTDGSGARIDVQQGA